MIDQHDLFRHPPAPARDVARATHAHQRPREAAARDDVLDAMELARASYLDQVRRAMTRLFWERHEQVRRAGYWMHGTARESIAWVSADDARTHFEILRPPADLNRNFLGAVWRGGWKALPNRRVQSATPGSHANELKVWTLDV